MFRSGGVETRVVGTTLGNRDRPHLLEAWGQRFNLQMDEGHLALFHYQDVPGMIGKLGSILGDHNINIGNMAVGRGEPGSRAAMAVTVDEPIPEVVLNALVETPGFDDARSVTL